MSLFSSKDAMRALALAAALVGAGWTFGARDARALGTPDGQPPSVESVCDAAGLSGAAWGLCNAYCEAMDCDSDFPHASQDACNRVFNNFVTKSGGRTPPCESGGGGGGGGGGD